MNKEQLKKRLEALEFCKEDYWIITGAVMVLYGLRNETRDIDMGCSSRLADELEEQGYPVTILKDGTRRGDSI